MGLCLVAGFVFYTHRRGGSLVEWFLVPYLAILLAYFAYAHRLALPIVPFFYSYLFLAVGRVGRREGESGNQCLGDRLQWLVFVILLVLNVAFFARNTEVTSDERLARQTERRLAKWIHENAEDDARLLYDFAPSLAVLTGRQVYSYRLLRRSSFIPQVDFALFTGQENRLEVRLKESSKASWLLPADDAHTETRIYRVVVSAGLRAGF